MTPHYYFYQVFLFYVHQGSGRGEIGHQVLAQTAFGVSTMLKLGEKKCMLFAG
jgi:hypothetical protein